MNHKLFDKLNALLLGTLTIMILTIMMVLGMLQQTAWAEPALPCTVALKDHAVVNGEIIRMRDVASMDAGVRERIGEIVISVSPEMGKSLSIQKQEIYEKLVGNGIASPEISGPSRITVSRQGTVVKPSFFKDKIHDYILQHSRWKDGVQVEIVTAKEITVPQSDVRWQITPANGQDFFGNVLFEVKAIALSTNDVLYSNWVTAKLKIIKPVPVSNRDIQRNEMITDNDIRWETREITPFTKDAILERDELVGQRADRIIRSNSVVTTSLLEKRFLVRRGEMATLEAKLKGVLASTPVKALSDGRMGDTVQVMNVNSKKIVTGVVTGKNTVEVNVQ
ncbi:MAG: flagellar basal body P-ring formation chaperone FlgA [Candidatus Omnitrophota bacterium]